MVVSGDSNFPFAILGLKKSGSRVGGAGVGLLAATDGHFRFLSDDGPVAVLTGMATVFDGSFAGVDTFSADFEASEPE